MAKTENTKPTPWRAYDVFTSEEVGRYETETQAYVANLNNSVVVRYMPSKRKAK